MYQELHPPKCQMSSEVSWSESLWCSPVSSIWVTKNFIGTSNPKYHSPVTTRLFQEAKKSDLNQHHFRFNLEALNSLPINNHKFRFQRMPLQILSGIVKFFNQDFRTKSIITKSDFNECHCRTCRLPATVVMWRQKRR